MTIENIKKFFKNYHVGAFTRIEKATNKNGYIKRVAMVARFVNYYNIASVKALNKTPSHKDYERVIIPHILKENLNTKNTLLLVYTTNNEKQKAKTSYFYNGEPITENEYYNGINEKKRVNNNSVVFTFNINDILSIGGVYDGQ